MRIIRKSGRAGRIENENHSQLEIDAELHAYIPPLLHISLHVSLHVSLHAFISTLSEV
jgi:hypothetical protein